MKRLTLSLAGAALAILALATAVSAAGPTPRPTTDQDHVRARDTVSAVLGLSWQKIAELRGDGLSLVQIADRQSVNPQKLIDALVAQWSVRIDARVQNGALTTDAATALKAQLTLRATAMVNQTAPGGMRGAAVGAGPANGNRAGTGGAGAGGAGTGTGICDGTGPHGPGRP